MKIDKATFAQMAAADGKAADRFERDWAEYSDLYAIIDETAVSLGMKPRSEQYEIVARAIWRGVELGKKW